MSDGWVLPTLLLSLCISFHHFVINLHLIIDTTSCILGRFWEFNSSTHLFTAFQSIDIFLFPYPLLPFLVAGYKHYVRLFV